MSVAKKLMTSPIRGHLDDQLEISHSGKWLVGVLMIVTDLLQKSAEGKFEHPTRDALDSAAIIQRCLCDSTSCHVVTLYGPLTNIVSRMGVVVKITCLSHGHI